jgi:CRISPR-associated protein Csb2
MSGYGKTGVPIPGWVSGHAAEGKPTSEPHMAVVPLIFAGFKHADGTLMGFAVIPPCGRDLLLDDNDFLAAVSAITGVDSSRRRTISLKLGKAGVLTLGVVLETERPSLDPARYCRRARSWASVTPLVLDRHLKAKQPVEREVEVLSLIAGSCDKIGLTHPARIVPSKHSAVHGVPSAYPSGDAPRWTGWRVPEHVAARTLTHVSIMFDAPVDGPVLLGAGRFYGLGLCLPLDPEPVQ